MSITRTLRRYRQKTMRIPEEARRAMQAALEQSGGEILAAQRALVSRDDGVLLSTLRMERAPTGRIGVHLRAGGARTMKPVRGGAKAQYDYALAVEFGTEHAAAKPFFYGPYRLLKARAKRRGSKAFRDAIRRAAA